MKYSSKYSPGKQVTELQYICEIICEKNAAYSGRELPLQFWKLPQWAQYYRSQTNLAKKLLDNYSAEAIIKALKDPRTKKVYSLAAPWIIPVIKEYEAKIKAEIKLPEQAPMGGDSFQRPSNKTSLLDKLDG